MNSQHGLDAGYLEYTDGFPNKRSGRDPVAADTPPNVPPIGPSRTYIMTESSVTY